MDETSTKPEDATRAFWRWLGFCVQFLILGLLTAIGAFVASENARPGDYLCGLLLSLGAITLGFLRLKHSLDGGNSGWGTFLLVDDRSTSRLRSRFSRSSDWPVCSSPMRGRAVRCIPPGSASSLPAA